MNSRPSFESKQNISFSQWYIGNKRRKRVVGERNMAKNKELHEELKKKGYGLHSTDDYVEKEPDKNEDKTPKHFGMDSSD